MLQLLQTLRYLKPIQIRYQIWYRLKRLFPSKKYSGEYKEIVNLEWSESLKSYITFSKSTFDFINLSKTFAKEIDWNFSEHGKLWIYNLNYFNYLHQEQIDKSEAVKIMYSFAEYYDFCKDGKEPYPTSLRIMNWVKYLSEKEIDDARLNKVLRKDLSRLLDNLEYHLLANHLLENAFALLFGAYYFKNEKIYNRAKSLLSQQLDEQIMEDGAHYERSPMYHQIILYRVLDCLQLAERNDWKSGTLTSLLQRTASRMLGWLEQITFSDGSIPLVNDAATGIAPSSEQLFEYARQLKVKHQSAPLRESGYRVFRTEQFEMIADVGDLSPNYQPGHAHADSLQFLLNIGGSPYIVDSGTATYEENERRVYERSTEAHNTVTVASHNSSDVWSSFRVGKRAEVSLVKDDPQNLEASHSGYRHLDTTHKRAFQFEGNIIKIKDELTGTIREGVAHLHFHPAVKIEQIATDRFSIGKALIDIKGASETTLEYYQWAEQFNKTKQATVLKISFEEMVETWIKMI